MSKSNTLELSTGIKSLDNLLSEIRWGDSFTWHTPSVKEYAIFVKLLIEHCLEKNLEIIYIKIDGSLEKIIKSFEVKVYNTINIDNQEELIENIKKFMKENNQYTHYIFDGHFIWNLFTLLSSYLKNLNSIAYLPLFKNSLSNESIVKIIDSAQILIDVDSVGEAISISPIKVSNRFTPNMYKSHIFDPNTGEIRLVDNYLLSSGDLVEKTKEVLKVKHDLEEFKERYQDLIEANFQPSNIIGKSKNIREVCELIGRIAKSEVTVLIQGESGTGKEVIAQSIYLHSLRNKQPFIKVNCAALTETLLESELFGHKKGAFTGAISDSKGKFRQAHGGTILLDEIGCMSLSGQAKLLRVLQEKEIIPVGESIHIKVDVRVIATTNTNLAQAVEEGKFREDLYYRLRVIPIYLFPLKERIEDIPLLARHFLKKYVEKNKKDIKDISQEAIHIMLAYSWPGNIRELENTINYALMLEETDTIQPTSLPKYLWDDYKRKTGYTFQEFNLKKRLEITEKMFIIEILDRVNGVKKDASALLGVDPRNLNYYLKKHQIVSMN